MSRVLFDADTGRLRLAPESFEVMLCWAEGGEVGPDGLRPLRDAGVVLGDRPHPAVAPAVVAMTAPLWLLTLGVVPVTEDAPGMHGAGWMGAETAALLLDGPDDLVELICLAPMFVPAALARVLDISPRPGPHVEDFTAARQWELSVRWPDHAGTTQTRTLRVVDTPTGLWIAADGEHPTLRRATPTTVWRRLLRLFPP